MNRLLKTVMIFAGLTLALTACPSGTDGGDNGDGGEAATILERVKERDKVVCGVNNAVPGFGFVDEDGDYSGFDIDFCKAVAAAVLGDASKVEFRSLTAEQRFTALQSNEVDVLIRNTTWTSSRDGTERAQFAMTTFYDGQGVMVKADSGITRLEQLDGQTICVLSGTTTELNLESVFRARKIDYEPQSLETPEQIQSAFQRDRCRGWTSDKSQLAGIRSNYPANDGGPDALRILDETISKEPLGPVVREGDADWFDAVNWTVIATIQAEEFGISSENIDEFLDSDDPNIQRFLGTATVTTAPAATTSPTATGTGSPTDTATSSPTGTGSPTDTATSSPTGTGSPATAGSPTTTRFNSGLGLEPDFAVDVIRAVGNYGQIYRRNVGPGTPLGLPRGLNALWTDGGLLYAPPLR